jgi:hypothetical protein
MQMPGSSSTQHLADLLKTGLGFGIVTLVMAAPFVDYGRLTTASYEGDSRLLIWTLAWDAHALLTRSPLFDANIFYPANEALAWTEHHIGIAVFSFPIYAATRNPVLAYWVVWLVAFPLNGLAMQTLAYRVTRDRVAAFGAGLVYAFCFFRMHHAHGHLQLLWTWALPLVPLAIERWVERPSYRRAAIVAMLVVLQALAGWYLAVFVALLSLAVAAFCLWSRRITRAHAVTGATVFMVSLVPLLWFAAPYTRIRAGGSGEAAGNSADLAAYFVPPHNTWVGQWVETHTRLTPRWIWGEQTLYVGATTLALALVGLWFWRHKREPISAAVLVVGGVALSLSLGPSNGFSPYDLFVHLPAMSLVRAPARFALLVMLAAALLVGMGVAQLRNRLGRQAPAALVPLALIGLSESYVIEFPGGKPREMSIPAVYELLTREPAGPVLSLPTYAGTPEAFRESDYLLFSTAHWRPIVNGFGRQDPPDHTAILQIASGFPAPESIVGLCHLQLRYVVVHTGRASGLRDVAHNAQEARNVKLVGRFGDDYLFRICDAL